MDDGFITSLTAGQDVTAEQQRYSLTGVPIPHAKTPPADGGIDHHAVKHALQQQRQQQLLQQQQQQQQHQHPQQHPLLSRTLYREPIFQLPSPPLIEPRLTMSR